MVLVALMGLAPTAALAHGSNGHPADPNLHVNPSLKDCSVQFSSDLTQDAFGRFTREFGSVSAFKHMGPPTTLGRRHVALAVTQMDFRVEEHADAWNDTFAHPDAYHELGSDLGIPKLTLGLGLTDDLDIGAYYTRNPNANYGWFGVELEYGLLHQSEGRPVSLAVRGAYTRTLYADDLDMNAYTADVSTGRTLWNVLTPYVGGGGDLVTARERSGVVELENEIQFVPRAFGGLELRLWHFAVGAEGEVGALNRLEMKVAALF
jgi:hypothetical protein